MVDITNSGDLINHLKSLISGAAVGKGGKLSGLNPLDTTNVKIKHEQLFKDYTADARSARKLLDKTSGGDVQVNGKAVPDFKMELNRVKDAKDNLKQWKRELEQETAKLEREKTKYGVSPSSDYLDTLKDRIKDGEEALEEHKTNLREKVQDHRDSVTDGLKEHDAAIDSLKREHTEIKTKLYEDYQKEREVLQRDKIGKTGNDLKLAEEKIAMHESNHRDLVRHLDDEVKKVVDEHNNIKKGARDVFKEVDKHLEIAGGKGAVEAAAKAGGEAGLFTRIGNNFKGGSGLKAGIGLVVAGVGGLKAAQDLMVTLGLQDAGRNPDGTEKEGPGLVKTLAEAGVAAGGLLLAGHGGHAR